MAEVNAAMATPALFCILFPPPLFLGSGREFDLKKIHGGPETGIIANYLDIRLSIDLRNLSGNSGDRFLLVKRSESEVNLEV